MSLPAPNLDDRTFQDIVDAAKRELAQRCPEWSDHNVSDPGVALIELFAWMSEMILYRLNQVPDLLYTKFLELVGIELFSAAPATVELTFWLSTTGLDEPVTIPAGTQAGTVRAQQEPSIVFTTDRKLTIRQPELVACLTATGDRYQDVWEVLQVTQHRLRVFPELEPGDAVYLGFAEPLGGHVLRLELDTVIEGSGVKPDWPPWAWEAWDGQRWAPAEVHEDTTSALNEPGTIILLLPPGHQPLPVGNRRACWVRCRLLAAEPGQRPYDESPELDTVAASVLGGTVAAHHAERVEDEVLGRSDGRPGQRFQVRRRPVLPRRQGEHVVVTPKDGELQVWEEVSWATLAGSRASDRHYTWDGATGEIAFGPAVRHPDGTIRQHGAIPPSGARITVAAYRHGGGRRGNVGANRITVLKSSVPFISRVKNLAAARGGVDAEHIDNAKRRGPMTLRTGQRAVTARDFQRLALDATREVARARCLPPAEPGAPARLLVVPRLQIPPDRLQLDDLALPDTLVERVSNYLEQRRLVTTTIELATPAYQGIKVYVQLRALAGGHPDLLRQRVLARLYRYVNPLLGGPEETGWPFGRPLNVGQLYALVAGIEGVSGIEVVKIFPVDLRTGEPGGARQEITLPDNGLFASAEHEVRVR